MAAYGLYTHIASNKVRSMVLLGGLFVLIYVIVFAGALVAEVFLDSNRPFDQYIVRASHDLVAAFPYATIASAIWVVIAYFFHQNIIDAVTGGHGVTRKEQPRLYNLLENLCISRGIPMPQLKIMETDALNAFATGLNQRQYAITVTTGLLRALNDDEMEAVLGHELTHIRNGDVQLMVIAVIIAGVVGFFGEMFFRIFFNSNWSFGSGSSSSRSSSSSSSSDSDSGSSKGGGAAVMVVILAIALIMLAWALSLVVRFALSRSREFLADAGSVELTKNPDAMISALRKIENRGELEGSTSAVMEMCIDNPREGFADLFATHPSVDARIKALTQFAGGRDPGRMKNLPSRSASDENDRIEDAGPTPLPQREPASTPAPANAPLDPPRRSPWGKVLSPWGRR